ncbi:hypothetical protein OIU77_024909 [Salix suchowensis]|uniref:Uncharacterized protein n=1 Tax=Salix suchowensis TaxID=1278906 RepID=A0ABQ9BV75_9ROSI|nr:hypothetical protein OIU77_024909 [Salix suchowensis]
MYSSKSKGTAEEGWGSRADLRFYPPGIRSSGSSRLQAARASRERAETYDLIAVASKGKGSQGKVGGRRKQRESGEGVGLGHLVKALPAATTIDAAIENNNPNRLRHSVCNRQGKGFSVVDLTSFDWRSVVVGVDREMVSLGGRGFEARERSGKVRREMGEEK